MNATSSQISAVETCASKVKQAKPLKPLKVDDTPQISKSRAELIETQRDDKSLSKLFALAGKGEKSVNDRGVETAYCVRNNLLYKRISKPTSATW